MKIKGLKGAQIMNNIYDNVFVRNSGGKILKFYIITSEKNNNILISALTKFKNIIWKLRTYRIHNLLGQ